MKSACFAGHRVISNSERIRLSELLNIQKACSLMKESEYCKADFKIVCLFRFTVFFKGL